MAASDIATVKVVNIKKMSDILYTLIIDYYTSTLSHLLNKMFVSDSAIFTGINETRKSCVALRS